MTYCLTSGCLVWYFITPADARREVSKIFRYHPISIKKLSLYDYDEYGEDRECKPLEVFYAYNYLKPEEVCIDVSDWEKKKYGGFTIAFKPETEGDNIRITDAGNNDDGRTCIAYNEKGILCQIDMKEQYLFPCEYLVRSYINTHNKGDPETYIAPFTEVTS